MIFLHLLRVILSLYFAFYFKSFIQETLDRVGDVFTSRLKILSFSLCITLCLLILFILATVFKFYVI